MTSREKNKLALYVESAVIGNIYIFFFEGDAEDLLHCI